MKHAMIKHVSQERYLGADIIYTLVESNCELNMVKMYGSNTELANAMINNMVREDDWGKFENEVLDLDNLSEFLTKVLRVTPSKEVDMDDYKGVYIEHSEEYIIFRGTILENIELREKSVHLNIPHAVPGEMITVETFEIPNFKYPKVIINKDLTIVVVSGRANVQIENQLKGFKNA